MPKNLKDNKDLFFVISSNAQYMSRGAGTDSMSPVEWAGSVCILRYPPKAGCSHEPKVIHDKGDA